MGAKAIRPGEGFGVFLLGANLFLLLATYYLLKTVREVFILSGGGAELKTYAAAAQALLLLGAVPLYGWLAARWNRARLVTTVTFFFAAHLVFFAAAHRTGVAIDVPFYLWLGIFNVVIVAQFWALASDVYTASKGRRLFPIVGIGSSLGALVGAGFSDTLLISFGPDRVILLAASLLIVAGATSWTVHRYARTTLGRQVPAATAPMKGAGGFRLVFSDRYLLLIALFVMLLNVVNTGGEFLLSKLVTAEASQVAEHAADGGRAARAFIASFYARYFTWVGVVGLLAQVFLVSRLFRKVGVAGALFVTPVIALGGYALLAAVPLLGILAATKLFENAADYSIQNTARHALFLSVGRDAKYKATQVIEGFFWRAGDLSFAALVFLGTAWAFDVRAYALLLTAVAAVWLIVVVMVWQEHSRRELRLVPRQTPTLATPSRRLELGRRGYVGPHVAESRAA